MLKNYANYLMDPGPVEFQKKTWNNKYNKEGDWNVTTTPVANKKKYDTF